MKELVIRSITGLLYGLLLVGSLLLHPIAFLVVYLSLAIFSIDEFIKLSRREGISPLRIPAIIFVASAFIIGFFYHYASLSKVFFLILPVQILFIYILELFRKKESPFLNLSMIFLGLIYVGLPMVLLNELIYSPYSVGYSPQLLLFLFLVIWINDTGAYIIGKLTGKHKLIKRVSPKKTWEGFAGGLTVALLATGFLGIYFTDIPRLDQWFLTLIIIIFGTLGDLVESLWKRSLGIKDSGKALPGHGGWLDRLDSILLAVPAVYITIMIINAI